VLGDRSIEFQAAGGMALSHREMGELDEADEWLDRAAAAAAAEPTPFRARQIETWRGLCCAARRDPAGMRRHLEAAVRLATDQGRSAGRCEALSQLALASARLGAESGDPSLLDLAGSAAEQVRELREILPGHAPWGARADAAAGLVALARGDIAAAAAAGGAAVQALLAALHEDLNLDIVLPATRAILAGGPPEGQAAARGWLRVSLSRVAQGTIDDAVRVRWLRGPVGRELAELAGPIDGRLEPLGTAEPAAEATRTDAAEDEIDRRLLRLLTEGNTNQEMADALGVPEHVVVERLARLLSRLGTSSRAEATRLAFGMV
jgi:DNA-binding NarL/FixJ family response regulator